MVSRMVLNLRYWNRSERGLLVELTNYELGSLQPEMAGSRMWEYSMHVRDPNETLFRSMKTEDEEQD